MISCIIIGILLIIVSYIKPSKKNVRKQAYKKPVVKKILEKFRNSSFIETLSDDDKRRNKTLKNKVELINKCKLSDLQYRQDINISSEYKKKLHDNMLKNVYLARIILIFIVLVGALILKFNFDSVILKEKFDCNNINKTTQYRISKKEAEVVVNYIGDTYKVYFRENKQQEFYNYLCKFIGDSKMEKDSSDIQLLFNIYKSAWDETRLTISDLVILIILALCSNYLVVLYVNLKYKICDLKMIKEFQRIELIAILNMNREELNIYEILKEINKYAVYLKPYLTRCLNSYTSNPKQSLRTLSKNVANDGFSNFIIILENCLDKPKDTNVEVLKLQRRLRYLGEKIDNDKDLKFKSICLTIAQYPLISVFMANMLLPFVSSINLSSMTMF